MSNPITRFFHQLYLIGRTILTSLLVIPSLILRSRWLRLIVVVLIAAVVLLLAYYWLNLAQPVRVYDAVWLDQGWTSDQMQKYFQTSQGTLILPYTWWQALEQPPRLPRFMSNFLDIGRLGMKTDDLWRSDDNVSSYRLMPDPIPTFNPDRNPIGVVKAVVPDALVASLGMGHKEWMSFSCAACHTGQLNYQGLGIRINGLPAQWDFSKFSTVMTTTLIFTRYWPTKFDRFAKRVFYLERRPYTESEKSKLRAEMDRYINSDLVQEAFHAIENRLYPTTEGFGRTAALGRGGNLQFFPLSKANDKLSKGPVSFPPLWYTHEFDWVQSPAAIRQPLGRNVTESWGVNVRVDLNSSDPAKLFRSTHPMMNLFWMETLVSVLEPPPWPEEYFGTIDWQRAERGRYLYEERVNPVSVAEYCAELASVTISPPELVEQPCPNPDRPKQGLCATCHAPRNEVVANQWGKTYIQLPLYGIDEIGTDPWDVKDFNANVGALDPGDGVYAAEYRRSPWGSKAFGIGTGLTFTTTRIMDKYFAENDPPFPREIMEGQRINAFRAPLAYPARPLAGYWATAPFLHNGSVPNLYELLSPAGERSDSFFAGNVEFDPIKLGFKSDRFRGGFKFKVNRNIFEILFDGIRGLFHLDWRFERGIDGNSNAGHEFRDAPAGTPGVIGPYLAPDERMDIIEYMKVLRDVPPLAPEEAARRRDLLAAMASSFDGKPDYEPQPAAAFARPEQPLDAGSAAGVTPAANLGADTVDDPDAATGPPAEPPAETPAEPPPSGGGPG